MSKAPPRLVVVMSLCTFAGAAVAIAFAADGGGGGGHLKSTASATESASRAGSTLKPRQTKSGYKLAATVEPAHVVSDPDDSAVFDAMRRVTNAWRVANHNDLTIVMAGLARDSRSRSLGRFTILRQSLVPLRDNSDVVDVPDAGALTITKAPRGRAVVTSAQRRGNVQFRSENGITGALGR